MYVNQYVFDYVRIIYTLIYYSCKQYSIAVWVIIILAILVIAKGANAELGQPLLAA